MEYSQLPDESIFRVIISNTSSNRIENIELFNFHQMTMETSWKRKMSKDVFIEGTFEDDTVYKMAEMAALNPMAFHHFDLKIHKLRKRIYLKFIIPMIEYTPIKSEWETELQHGSFIYSNATFTREEKTLDLGNSGNVFDGRFNIPSIVFDAYTGLSFPIWPMTQIHLEFKIKAIARSYNMVPILTEEKEKPFQ